MTRLAQMQDAGVGAEEQFPPSEHASGTNYQPKMVLCMGPVSIDCDNFSASVNGRSLSLTRLEFDILAYLIRNPVRVISKEELLRRVVRTFVSAESSLIRVHISHLRRKLGPQANIIETVRGRGFRCYTSQRLL